MHGARRNVSESARQRTAEELDGDELISPGRDKVTMRRRAIPIQVISPKPLLVRAGLSVHSDVIGQLQPEQLATVIEERILPDGDHIRACVTFDEYIPDVIALGSPRSPRSPRLGSPRRGSNVALPERILPDGSRGASREAGAVEASRESSMGVPAPTTGVQQTMAAASPLAAAPRGFGATRGSPPPQLTGWVTIKQKGKKNVTSRVRIDPWIRQRAS